MMECETTRKILNENALRQYDTVGLQRNQPGVRLWMHRSLLLRFQTSQQKRGGGWESYEIWQIFNVCQDGVGLTRLGFWLKTNIDFRDTYWSCVRCHLHMWRQWYGAPQCRSRVLRCMFLQITRIDTLKASWQTNLSCRRSLADVDVLSCLSCYCTCTHILTLKGLGADYWDVEHCILIFEGERELVAGSGSGAIFSGRRHCLKMTMRHHWQAITASPHVKLLLQMHGFKVCYSVLLATQSCHSICTTAAPRLTTVKFPTGSPKHYTTKY